MKKIFMIMRIIVLFMVVRSCHAALIDFTWTNWDGTISTNDLIIAPVVKPINDGTTTIKGITKRYATTNGFLEKFMLTGFYSVIPYGENDVEPIIFEVPNDSNTYDFWSLRRSGGHLFVTAGVLGLYAGQGIALNPTNGMGFVTVTSAGGASNVFVNAGSNGVQVVTNTVQSLFTVSLSFLPQAASLALSNWASLSTNVFYPSNNPAGFIPTNALASMLGYQTNAVTTNGPTGMTNVIRAIASGSGSLAGLSDVRLSTPGNGERLTYENGNWTNEVGGGISSVGLTMPSEFSVAPSSITSSGSFGVTKANQSANLVYAGPSSGSPGQPTFRALVVADIPGGLSQTLYASNVLSGGQLLQLAMASNSPANGWLLGNSNGVTLWMINGGSLTNLRSSSLVGLVSVTNLGSNTLTSGAGFLRNDNIFTNWIIGSFTIQNGNFTNSGNSSLDAGLILSDGSGNITAVKFNGAHQGNGSLLTSLPAGQLTGTIADARLSSNVPLKSDVNVWANNNDFQAGVQFDSGFSTLGSSTVSPSLGIGPSSSLTSNTLSAVNALNRQSLELNTNGAIWFTTNHFFFINWDGSAYIAGLSNHLVHQLVSESQITANSFNSLNYFGNGSGLSNITSTSISNAFDPSQFQSVAGVESITNGAATTNLSVRVDGSRSVSNKVNNGHWKLVRGDNVVFMDFDSAGGISFPQGIVVPLDGSQITSGTVGTSFLPILGLYAPQALTNNAKGFVTWQSNAWNFGDTGGSQWLVVSNGVIGVMRAATNSGNIQSATFNATSQFNGSGAGLTSLDGSQVSAGTVALARGGTGASLSDPGANKILGWDDTDNANGYWTLGTGFSYSHSTHTITSTAGTGSDTSAWHQDGDQVSTPSHTYILGPTNGNLLNFRMRTTGDGADIVAIEAGATPHVNMYAGLTNGAVSATEFQCTIWGGQHNVINTAGVTADSIFGGQFNTISAGGGGNYGATILGGSSNIVAGTGAYAMGVGAHAINDYAWVWCGLPNRVITTSGSGGDNGKMLLAFSNAGVEFTNGNDASICGDLKLFGQALYSTNCAEARAATLGWTNGAGGFGLLWLTTNSPYAGRDLKLVNGSLGGSNSVVLGTQVRPQAFQLSTNGHVRLEGDLNVPFGTITGSGAGLSAIPPTALTVSYITNIASHFADVGNTGTSDTSLYTDTIPASTLGANGNKLYAQYGLNLVSHATATRQIKVFFGGTSIFDSGALVYAGTSPMADIDVKIIRDSSTSIRYDVRMSAVSGTITNFVSVGKLTGLTLSGSNTLELHGQAGGVGAASSDIVATLGNVDFKP